MTTDQYISVREAAQLLGNSEKKVMDLIEEGDLQAYRIAGQFLRLKRRDVLTVRNSGDISPQTVQHPYTFGERVRDFFYFNDFYLICLLIIAALFYQIFFKG